ncbi:MAG: zf-HC2 domain-containing protein [Candidatus Marinimicrobia bacterium]|nr:zf-HC2 domain-containing protein [Candidatus Neomarinimicrobiota bacterium]MDD5582203.1 zf-HC2 domain-containing protein [Candidatus Neomarinimicrobiota bacterium]
MDCYSFSKYLTDYLDNQLKLPQRREVESHMRECPVCQGKVEDMKNLLNALHMLQKVSASDSFEAELLEKIHIYQNNLEHSHTFRTFFFNHIRTFSAVAAVILVIVSTLVIWQSYHPRAGNLPAGMNSAPVMSSMGSSSSSPRQEPATNPVNPPPKTTPMALTDSLNNEMVPDDTFNLDFLKNRIQLVNEQR